jgi:GNAT superfamily N-acetyltransferase
MTAVIGVRPAVPGAAGAAALGPRLRPAGPADAQALHALFGRCSHETRAGRFHGLLHALPEPYLTEALTADDACHDALVLETPGSLLVALASARRAEEPGEPAAELGLLVEDPWQHRGLGTLLLTALAVRARARGVRVLRCDVLADRERLVAVLRRTLGPVTVRREGPTVHAEVRLAGPGDPGAGLR